MAQNPPSPKATAGGAQDMTQQGEQEGQQSQVSRQERPPTKTFGGRQVKSIYYFRFVIWYLFETLDLGFGIFGSPTAVPNGA